MPINTEDITESKTFNVPPPTWEETQLLLQEIQLGQARIDQLMLSGTFTADIFTNPPAEIAQIKANPEAAEALKNGQYDVAISTLPQVKQLLAAEVQNIANGGKVDPQTAAYIDTVYGSQLASGKSDIKENARLALEQLREELAPSLGLRPEDTPILDRGGRVMAESTRQQGQLERDIAGKTAEAKLNFPLAQGDLTSRRTAQYADISRAATDFQNQLQQQAFLNRQLLTESAGNLGLNFITATGSSPGTVAANLGQNRASLAPSTVTASSSNFDLSSLASGIGAGLEAIDYVRDWFKP